MILDFYKPYVSNQDFIIKIRYSKIKIVRMIAGSTTGNFYGVYMEVFKTKLGKKNF